MNIRRSIIDLSPSFDTPPTVLVVDDSAETLSMLCEWISAANYAVLMAGNSNEALKYLEFTIPDAILIDAVSPNTEGFKLGRRVKSMPAWADIPVLFMVELANTDQIISSFENGGTDYLPKPLRISEVLARLTTHVITRIKAGNAMPA